MLDNSVVIADKEIPKKELKNRYLSSTLSICFVALLMLILFGSHRLTNLIKPKIDVRKIGVAIPPPPPPPMQPQMQQQQQITLDISTEGNGAVLPIIEIPKTIKVSKPDMPEVTLNEITVDVHLPDIKILDLNQLDSLPILITRARIVMPESLKRRGIKKALVKLDVIIRETGAVTLNQIVENPYPELNKEILRLIRRSKFSAPQKEGTAVSTRFIWPIDISV